MNKEEFYNKEIAPVLLKLSKKCKKTKNRFNILLRLWRKPRIYY
jgi:hypothetical protein